MASSSGTLGLGSESRRGIATVNLDHCSPSAQRGDQYARRPQRRQDHRSSKDKWQTPRSRFYRRTQPRAAGALSAILRRGADRGELPVGTDLGLIVDAAFGVVWYRMLIAHAPLTPKVARALTDRLLGATLAILGRQGGSGLECRTRGADRG